jgi:hypothetical protein
MKLLKNVESLPKEIGQAISAISNLIEASGDERNETEKITKTITSLVDNLVEHFIFISLNPIAAFIIY